MGDFIWCLLPPDRAAECLPGAFLTRCRRAAAWRHGVVGIAKTKTQPDDDSDISLIGHQLFVVRFVHDVAIMKALAPGDRGHIPILTAVLSQ